MDQKLENILNLALETPEEEREQTESLNVGYSAEIRSWELIVKYHGSLDRLREQNIVVEELIAGYAILTVPEALVDTVSDTPEIESFAPLVFPAAKKHRIYRYEPHGLCRKIFRWLCILRRLCNNDRVFS